MKAIKQNYTISAAVEKVWKALVDPREIEKWGAGPAKMDDKAGSKFSIWGGDIHGTNATVIENKVLEQDWYGGDWDQPSKVRFELKQKGNKTGLELIHENIPDDEAKDIDDGWKQYYLGPMKEYLEK